MDNYNYYLEEFKKYISLQTSSVNTIKNYLSDLRVFFTFVQDSLHLPVSSQTLPTLLTESTLVKYDEYLSVTNPPATAKRRTSSLKKFIEFCASQNIILPASPLPPIAPVYSPAPPPVFPSPVTPIPQAPPVVSAPLTPPASIPTTPSGPTPWSAVLHPQPTHPVTEPSPSIVSYLPNFAEDNPRPAPVHSPDISPPAPKSVSLYLVLSLILIAFLASFSLTYLLATNLLSK